MKKIALSIFAVFVIISANAQKKISNDCANKPKYLDKSFAPNGIKAYFDYEQAIKCAKKEHKPVFIYFTGHASFGDRSHEKIFFNKEVKNILTENFITAFLYVDDRTELLKEDYLITKTNDTIKTLGKKNEYWQITKLNKNCQPYFVIIDSKQNLINNPISLFYKTDNFLFFLKEALTNFKK